MMILNVFTYLCNNIKKISVPFQKVRVIFFSAAKETAKERKISEETEPSNDAGDSDSDTESATSSIPDDSGEEKEAIKSTEEDIEMFKKQLGDLDAAVSTTANKLDRIQDALDKVLENLRLGTPVEPFHSDEASAKVDEDVGTEDVLNSHEIFDRNQLLAVLKSQKLRRLKNPPRITFGMIGYPNVGKSSTVNIIMQTKKVSFIGHILDDSR